MQVPAATSTSNPLRLLVVEDSALLAARLREMIDQLPAVQLLDIVDGQAAAIAVLKRAATDLVILDLNLKDGSGLGVLRYLREQRSAAEAIIFSNSTGPAYRLEADKLGVSLFLDKACDFESLMELLLTRSTDRTPLLYD